MNLLLDIKSIIFFLYCVLISTVSCFYLLSSFRWPTFAIYCKLDKVLSCLLAPFLFGFVIVIFLFLFPGFELAAVRIFLCLIFSLISAFYIYLNRARLFSIVAKFSLSNSPWPLRNTILSLYLLVLFAISLLIVYKTGLIQNDSLEYMIVAREIANTGGISIYPLVDAASSQSGFYAPMTHPPIYVSLLYFFGANNSVDQVPIIGQRMVSLWFFYSSCFALFSLTSQRNVFRGLLSILLLVSMPLAFLGATASLIDPLFISSTAILVLLVVSFPVSAIKSSWLLVGIALGLSLWSHSQSILLLPIFAATFFIFNGVMNLKNSALVLLKIIILAVVIISPAYINSTLSLGSPVSDNPPVFALASLEWSTWFEFNRGLYTNISKLQCQRVMLFH